MTYYEVLFTLNTNAEKLNIFIPPCSWSHQHKEVQCSFSLAVASSNYDYILSNIVICYRERFLKHTFQATSSFVLRKNKMGDSLLIRFLISVGRDCLTEPKLQNM